MRYPYYNADEPSNNSYNIRMRRGVSWMLFAVLLIFGRFAFSQSFDLAGPKVDVRVKRGQITLPIAEVPNLQPGDRIWVHADLPESQSARFVLVVSFLRGATNPPPPEWFTRVETWTREAREEGVFVTVPQEAQQALIFLAPETSGDFTTLRHTVRGRPGIFVRATQDLQAASWDRMRLNRFLEEVKVTSQTDPALLKERVETSARSLGIKVNQDCFLKPTEQQASCLSQHTQGLVMDDANTQSRVSQIASGSTADLMNQLSYAPAVGGGVYSPYVGAIVDTVRILSSLHTAHYQYIPALALPSSDTLNLRLSVPPSFRDPKSVVIVALPPIGPAQIPPLHPVDPAAEFCIQKPGLVFPAEGAPLALATEMAHDLNLHIEASTGPIDLPLRTDPSQGGLALLNYSRTLPPGTLTGVVRGKWGFDDWEGPRYHLHSVEPGNWTVIPGDETALIVGRIDTLHLHGDNTLCVDKVEEALPDGHSLPLTWKSPKAETLEIQVPMKETKPGQVTLKVLQYGLKHPDVLPLQSYTEAASLHQLSLSAGDNAASLMGTRLDEVAAVSMDGIRWSPKTLNRVDGADRLMLAADSSTAGLMPGTPYSASVRLKDGRLFQVPVSVSPPRPQIVLLSKGTQDEASNAPSVVQFGSSDDFPVDRRLVFFVRSMTPANFPRDEKIEVAALDASFHTVLSLADGSLMLEDQKTALAVIQPLARFGSSAFGPIHIRAISADGVTGDWVPLGTLVRIPGFQDLRCPRAQSHPCMLTGSNLFLADSFSTTQSFEDATDVPAEFTGTEIAVPHPVNGILYVKLRDDSSAVQSLSMAVQALAPAGQSLALKAAVPAAASASQTESDPATPSAPHATPHNGKQPQEKKAPEGPASANASASAPASGAAPASQAPGSASPQGR